MFKYLTWFIHATRLWQKMDIKQILYISSSPNKPTIFGGGGAYQVLLKFKKNAKTQQKSAKLNII